MPLVADAEAPVVLEVPVDSVEAVEASEVVVLVEAVALVAPAGSKNKKSPLNQRA